MCVVVVHGGGWKQIQRVRGCSLASWAMFVACGSCAVSSGCCSVHLTAPPSSFLYPRPVVAHVVPSLAHCTARHTQGRVYAPGTVPDSSADAVRAFNKALLSDERVEVVHVPFRDGVGLVRRRWVRERVRVGVHNCAAAPVKLSRMSAH